jgi:inosine/xanthosine triphosphatase
MKINIGTKNNIKIEALRETIAGYDFLAGAVVEGIECGSAVSDQPKSLEETVRGAKNRAQSAFNDCREALSAAKGDLSAGIEDGLMLVPGSLTGFMNLCVCALYDGKRYYLGTSAGFEYPPAAIDLVKKGKDVNQAFHELGLTNDPEVGSSEGAIGILTKNRWRRKDTVKQSIIAALIQLDNKDIYQ